MAYIREGIVKETSTTTGTGNYTRAGAASAEFRAFSAVCATGDVFSMVVREAGSTNYEEGFYTYQSDGTIARTVITDSSNAGAAVNWGAGTRYLSMGEGSTNEKIRTLALAADYTNSTTTGTEVTGLSMTVPAGVYRAEYRLLVRSAATTTGFSFGGNYTGTETSFVMQLYYPSTGTTASTGIADDASAGATDQLMDSFVTRTASTTAPNLGPLTGVATANQDHFIYVDAIWVVSDSGDIELWCASEVAASQVTIKAGSSVTITKVS